MLNSSFTTLRVVGSVQYSPIFIKVTTEVSKPRYCYFVPMMFNLFKPYIPQHDDDEYETTEIGYKKSILEKGVITCHIHCKSVEKFTVEGKKSLNSCRLDSEAFISI
jgi:hypothetical protein